LGVREIIGETAVPSGAGCQFDLEGDAAIGVDRRRVVVARRDRHLAKEILVAVGGRQTLLFLGPFGGDVAAPNAVPRLHLEEVGEIAAKRDLEIEADLGPSVVGQIEILVDATVDVTAEHQAERVLPDRALLADEVAVCKEDTRGEGGGRAAVEQVPRLAVGIHGPAADHAGVVEVETLLARPVDLTVEFAEEHGVPLMDRELRRPYLDFERHVFLRVCLRLRAAGRILRTRWPPYLTGTPFRSRSLAAQPARPLPQRIHPITATIWLNIRAPGRTAVDNLQPLPRSRALVRPKAAVGCQVVVRRDGFVQGRDPRNPHR